MNTFEYRQMTRDQQLQYLVEQRAKFDIFTGPTADAMRKQYDEPPSMFDVPDHDVPLDELFLHERRPRRRRKRRV